MSDSLRAQLAQALGAAFVIEREMGGGGMSRVFVARDVALDREVVVKVLDQESTAGVSGERFRREIQTIARLQHPHIVPIHSAGAADGTLYYVMPFVRGETLRARLAREGPMPVADVVRVLREVLDALAFAHGQGVVHRDIKPENVLIEAGHAVVADFGIAKALRESGNMTSAGIAIGTPAYMAPEQATADPSTDHRADLYAVGVMAWELLVGKAPFTGTPQQVITAHLTTPAPALRQHRPDVPPGLSNIIMQALAKDAAERPSDAATMSAALDGMHAPASPTRMSRKPWLAAAAAVVAVGAGAFLWSQRASTPSVVDGAERIAVMPLGAVSDSSLDRLGQDLVVTLSTTLDGVGTLRTVDAATILMRARTLPSPMPRADAQAVARDLGATSVLTGTLISVGDSVQATVELRGVATDTTLATAVARALPRDIASLTDSLSWILLRKVWRSGDVPSPVLTGLTTTSFDALRAFLDAERQFQRLEVPQALLNYRRAFELDSNFAQAHLRLGFANDWLLLPPDSASHARLLAVKHRLPERDRLWVETRELRAPFPVRVATWQSLAARFPDHPPILMSAADPLVHTGPLYGYPLADARPVLERLEKLMPGHADTRLHLAWVMGITGTPDESARAMEAAADAGSGTMKLTLGYEAAERRAFADGKPLPPPADAFPMARALATDFSRVPAVAVLIGWLGLPTAHTAHRLEALDAIRRQGIFTPEVDALAAFGEGGLRVSRGDWGGALNALQRVEQTTPAFAAFRLGSATMATFGAFLETVDPAAADSAIRRARQFAGALPGTVRHAELQWMDGMVGVTRGDSSRVRAAIVALSSDTVLVARHLQRSLAAHWMHRSNPEAAGDSLKAVNDQTMRDGGLALVAAALDRFVVARTLVRRGRPQEADRYLMWVDGALNAPQAFLTLGIAPLVNHERALAFDAAGNRAQAIVFFRRFLRAYEQPPPAHRALVDAARRRLQELETNDAPVPPRRVSTLGASS